MTASDVRLRSHQQNRFLHALLADLADQLPWGDGVFHDVVWWKRRATLQWLLDNEQPCEVITPLYRHEGAAEEFRVLLPHTSDLTTAQFASLCDWIIAFGTTEGVKFRDPKRPT